MSIGMDWSGDDDTLSQNTSVYGQVYGGQTRGLRKQVEGQAKSDIRSNKATAAAVEGQTSDEQHAAAMGAISGTVQGLLSAAVSFVPAGGAGAGAGGAAGKSQALAGKSAAAGTKSADLAGKAELLKGQQTSALAQGQTAKAARFGRQAERAATRSANIGARSANLASKSQAYGYKAQFGGKLPKLSSSGTLTGQELAAHQEAMNIIDPPLAPGSAVTGGQLGQAGTGFHSASDEAWFRKTGQDPSRTLSYGTFNK